MSPWSFLMSESGEIMGKGYIIINGLHISRVRRWVVCDYFIKYS